MLTRLEREFAAEIRSHDFSDAPYRLDRAGHQRTAESLSKRAQKELSPGESDYVRTNVMWLAAQVLKHENPGLDLHEFAAACGIPRSITHRTNGKQSDVIRYGLRWKDPQTEIAASPGAPLWQAQMTCNVGNVVVFRRLLDQVDEFDPTLPPVVESDEGSKRIVTVAVRGWDRADAVSRAVGLVTAVSTSVGNGTPAVLICADQVQDVTDFGV